MENITLPQLPPTIVNRGSKGGYYIYSYKNEWDPIKKRSKRVNSKLIGKILGGDKNGEVEFTHEFISDYPDLEHLKAVRENGKWKFSAIDAKETILKNAPRSKQIYHAGATWALDNIVATTPIGKALNWVFNKYHDDKKILSLIYYIILNQNNSMHRYAEFAESTRLPYQKPMCSSVISRLFQRIEPDMIDRFLTIVNDMYFKNRLDASDKIYLAFDSTSISTYSKELTKAEYGHNKDGDDTRQVNVMLLVDQSNGMPLFYRAYDGAVPDVTTVRNTIADCTRLNLKSNIVFVADKGYPSVNNINDCLINDYGFIFNTKINVKNSFIYQEIEQVYNELISSKSYDFNIRQNAMVRDIDWLYDDYPIHGKRKKYSGKAKLKLHIFYSKEYQNSLYDTILFNTGKAVSLVKQNGGSTDGLFPFYKQMIELYTDYKYNEETKVYSDIEISDVKINARCKFAGIRALITNQQELTSQRVHEIYFERNQVEYAFSTLKYRLNCNRFKCSSDNALEGKVFVQFLATTLSMLIRYKLKKHKNDVKDKKIRDKILYQSDSKILSSLNNIFATVYDTGIIYNEVVGKKISFYQALGVPVPTSEVFKDNNAGADSATLYDDLEKDEVELLEEKLERLDELI